MNRRDRYNLIPPIRLAKLTTVGPWVGDFVSSSFGSSPLLEYDELLCDLPLLDDDDDDAPYISNSLIAAVALVALFLDEFDDTMPTPTATVVTVIKASAGPHVSSSDMMMMMARRRVLHCHNRFLRGAAQGYVGRLLTLHRRRWSSNAVV